MVLAKEIVTERWIIKNGQKIMMQFLERKRVMKMSVVKVIGLKTGEQVLAQVETTGKDLLLKKPTILVPAGEKGIGLAPWMPYTKAADGIVINGDSITFSVDAVKELEDHYITSVVNGLVVPSKEVATPQLQLTESE